MNIGGGITTGRDEEQDKKIEDFEKRILNLEDVANIGKGQDIKNLEVALVEESIHVLQSDFDEVRENQEHIYTLFDHLSDIRKKMESNNFWIGLIEFDASVIKKEYSKKIRYRIRDWYRNQL